LDGRYYIGRVLGQGGFGVTYIAWDLKLNRYVAIKEYLPGDQCSRQINRTTIQPHGGEKTTLFEHGLRGFLSEATLLARFAQHPCIVTILDHIEANGTAYLVMEYLKGRTLKDYLAGHGGRIPWSNAIAILTQVMDALREVHVNGALHRDVAPDNIFITDQPQAVLIDFGAARQVIGEHSKNLTAVLKPGLAPFEQYSSTTPQGPWTDVYAAAATLYRCVTGILPPQAVDRLANDELEPPSKYCLDLPPGVDAAICKGLALRAKDRYCSIEEFQAALRAGSIAPPPPPPPVYAGSENAGPSPIPPMPADTGGGVMWGGVVGGVVLFIVFLGLVIGGFAIYDNQQKKRAEEANRAHIDRLQNGLVGTWSDRTEYDGNYTNSTTRFHAVDAHTFTISRAGSENPFGISRTFQGDLVRDARYTNLNDTGHFSRRREVRFELNAYGYTVTGKAISARTRDDRNLWMPMEGVTLTGTISDSGLSYRIVWTKNVDGTDGETDSGTLTRTP
jgi:serine/threonine protein kinase